MTGGRGTGIPTIQDELTKNGSPRAIIETDEQRSFFLIDIPVHEGFGNIVELHDENVNANEKEYDILCFCKEPQSRRDIFTHIGVIYHSKNYTRFVEPLIDMGLLELTIPDKPKSPNQKFKLTDKGRNLISSNRE